MNKILDELIAKSPDGVAQVQLMVRGIPLTGVVFPQVVTGVYTMLAMVQTKPGTQPIQVKTHIREDAIDLIMEPAEEPMIKPVAPGNLIIGGR